MLVLSVNMATMINDYVEYPLKKMPHRWRRDFITFYFDKFIDIFIQNDDVYCH